MYKMTVHLVDIVNGSQVEPLLAAQAKRLAQTFRFASLILSEKAVGKTSIIVGCVPLPLQNISEDQGNVFSVNFLSNGKK